MKLQNIILNCKNSGFDLYKQLCSQIYQPGFILGGKEYPIYAEKHLTDITDIDYQEWMMYVDSQTYMSDDILTKVDRAAMAVSLETRVPFLDHRIYEFAWSLPLEYKIGKNGGKQILRDVLYNYVPQSLIDRPKMGFGVPLAKWLRQDLFDWASSLLNYKKIREQGYLDPDTVQRYWQEHLSGRRNWQAALWNILMFQSEHQDLLYIVPSNI